MEYKEARKKIKSGHLLAWSGNTFFSNLIKFFTKSFITHVGIAWKIGGRLFVIESIEGVGVRIFPASRLTPFFWIYSTDGEENKWTDEIEETALKRVGEKYSIIGCIKALLGRPLKKDKNWQCAEFSSYILELLGYDAKGYTIPDNLVKKMLGAKGILIEVTKKK